MSIIGSNILAGASGSGVSAYEIEQSLRFDGSGTGFPPTGGWLGQDNPSSGGSTTQWTCSFWAKRGNSGSVKMLMSSIYQPNNDEAFGIQFTANDTLKWGLYSATIFETTQVFRDYSAWYHIVLVWDSANATAAHRCRLYVNGEEVTTWTTRNDPALNAGNPWCQNGPVPSGSQNLIGYQRAIGALAWYQSLPYNGYMAEFHCVQGQALDPTDFGEYDDNGVWRPIQYTGSYTGNSFYLKFDAADIDGDSSGLGNDWTATGFTTSGTGTDVMSDTPTTNWCTLNPLEKPGGTAPVYENGNLTLRNSTDYFFSHGVGTFALNSGKWYFETSGDESIYAQIGFVDSSQISSMTGGGGVSVVSRGWSYQSNGIIRGASNTYQDTGLTAASTAGDIMGLAIDFDAGEASWYVNGTQVGSTVDFSSSLADGRIWYPVVAVTNEGTDITNVNFGQRAFEYTPPTGFKALNTANLPAPDIADGSDYFNTVLYTGNQTARDITVADNSGNAWQPDFVWLKSRAGTQGSANHILFDAVRGANNGLYSSLNYAEGAYTQTLTSFNSDGFSLGTDADFGGSNWSSTTYVAWNWLAGNGTSSNTDGSITSTVSANPDAGFSIVGYTGTGANATVGHGLGVAPKMVIIKNRDVSSVWAVYHQDIGATKYLNLSGTAAAATYSLIFNNTSPTSTVFSIGTAGDVNNNTNDLIAYCFAEVEGYSKFGSYVGNGSSDGPFVWCGFKPAYFLSKNTGASNWLLLDVVRGQYYNPIGYKNSTRESLYPNRAVSEASTGSGFEVDFLSNGFKVRSSVPGELNQGGYTYVFAAFSENPFGGSGVSPATAR